MEEKVIILAGNPNTGKTTVFNALTGLRQKTGNWPGVTVEVKEGYFTYRDIRFRVIDLPGTYSLTSFSEDEKIARDILVKQKADAVVTIVDSSNLERNLYLVTLLLELEQKVVIDLNMYDIAEEKGITVDTENFEKIIPARFVKTVASRKEGIDGLKEVVYETVREENPKTSRINYGVELEEIIASLENLVKDFSSPYPSRFFAIRLLEKDTDFINRVSSTDFYGKIKEILEAADKRFPEIEDCLMDRRYGFIHGVTRECSSRKDLIEEKIELTSRLDRIFTHSFFGGIIFLFFIWLTFSIVFNWGGPFTELLGRFFSFLAANAINLLHFLHLPEWSASLVGEGIITGVGSVLVFLPNIFLLFFIFAALEDSGYMARAAFVTDRLMHKIGLHGKSAIPMILGFGCNVPAIMATRTLETKKDRIITIMALPFMSCSARLPVYLLFTGIFFKKYQGTVLFSLYIIGLLMGLLTAKLFKSAFFREETIPIIMELPPYHAPDIKGMLISAWERSYLFLRKAGSMIFAGVVLVWLLSYFPLSAEYASENSFTGIIGRMLSPLLKPAGFGFWQAGVALLFGLVAKELVVGTLGTVMGGSEPLAASLSQLFTPVSAYAFMLMTLLYIPCLATVAVIKQEAGAKWAAFATAWSLFIGWVAAVLFYQIFRFF
ncbi:MAG: ferrous iron transport protein B [Candidatus Omnitrophica bacterium]|nr:ferrous iron transport protein B [Candidatus Omnitrophota bacterium]